MHDEHIFADDDGFSALAGLSMLVGKARARLDSEMLRGNPMSHGANLLDCFEGVRAWCAENPPHLTLQDVTDEEGHPLEGADESGAML